MSAWFFVYDNANQNSENTIFIIRLSARVEIQQQKSSYNNRKKNTKYKL